MTRENDAESQPEGAGAAGAAPSGKPRSAALKKGGGRRIVAGVILLAVIAAGCIGYWFLFVRGIVSTDDARLAGHMVDISPQVGGRLAKVLVGEGDHVKKGQLLFAIDKSDLQASVDRAKAAVSTAEAGVELVRDRLQKAVHGPRKEQIMAARAATQRARVALDLAKTDRDREQRLFSQKATTKVALDRSQAKYQAATQALSEASHQLRLLEEGTRSEDIEAAHTAVKVAEAKLDQARAGLGAAQIALSHATATAPFAGVVVRRWLNPGVTVSPGRPVLTLFNPATLRVDANIEEKNLHEVAIGDKVDISIDAYPGVTLHGRVTQILRATNSQFSLVPAEGVSGTFIKVAQRIPLRIAIDKPPAQLLLGPGLSVECSIHTGTSSAGATQTMTANAP